MRVQLYGNDREMAQLFSDQERRKVQHEIRIYLMQYFKRILGRGIDDLKICIFEDILIIKLTGFLTEPEKYIIRNTPDGSNLIRAARIQVGEQNVIDNTAYFEKELKAKIIFQSCDMDPKNDFACHLIIFDRMLI